MALTAPAFETVTDLAPFDASEFTAANQSYDTNPQDASDVYTERDEPVLTSVATIAEVNNVPVIQSAKPFEDLAKKGFNGLEDDWKTSPMISLKTDGQFEDATGANYGKTFSGYVTSSLPKYAYSFAGATDPKTELVYSYDKEVTTKGTLLSDFKAQMVARGKEVTEKRYMEVEVTLFAPGTAMDGESRKLSVSPSSVSNFAAHMKKLERFGIVYTALTVVSVGEKIKFGTAPAFYPWAFAIG